MKRNRKKRGDLNKHKKLLDSRQTMDGPEFDFLYFSQMFPQIDKFQEEKIKPIHGGRAEWNVGEIIKAAEGARGKFQQIFR